ncbi:hypothetical protein DB35_04900 [Streptomyces abyssalis]|uniref:Uncharacterized protein n=1 Tax=Streptomyces abyssalis TaxID=933944 RepID=A0A1E7JQK4_9ACTN|nr:hypothetical protein [Streptomyces abyssalis]OEU90524.1 hypothetical protein AN215_13975 [Streptomyces abyssalis]OEU95263.1 hypothetical protein DB35_04900 [Streptomyces abyssalis]
MRIRLHGAEDECRRTGDHLAEHLDELDISRPYPDRPPSHLVRLYLTANPPTSAATSREIETP